MFRFQRCEIATVLMLMLMGTLVLSGHPADTNGDQRIDVGELTAYASAWSEGASWPEGPSPIDEAHVQRAEYLWQAGERYKAVSGPSAPHGWVPDPVTGAPYVALEAASSQPFEFVEVYGVDPLLNLSASFLIDDYEDEFQAILDKDGSSVAVMVPVHPVTMKGEGMVRFILRDVDSDEEWRSPPVQLEALPDATGAAMAMANSLESTLTGIADGYGFTLGDYENAPLDSVPEQMRPLVYMKAILDHPENPDSLERILTEQLTDEERAVWDAIVAKTGIGSTIASRHASVGSRLRTMQAIADQSIGVRDDCDGNSFLNIGNDPSQLQSLMNAQRNAANEISNEGSARDNLNKIVSTKSNFDLGKQAYETVKGVKPGGAGPGIGDAIGVTLLYAGFFDFFDKGTLPKEFTELELVVQGPGRGYFLEDVSGCETAIVRAFASVQSEGYDHEEMLANTVPGNPIPGLPGFDTPFKWINENYPNLDILDTSPDTWCDIPVSSDVYSTATGDEFLEVVGFDGQANGIEFKPKAVGAGEITVTVKGDQFAGASISSSIIYETRPIQVDFVAPQLRVTGDEETVTYTVQLTDAAQTGEDALEWTVSAGTKGAKRALGGGTYELDWTPSENDEDYPVTITAKSATEECLRGNAGAPPREDSISVEKEGWEIIPAVACLDEGEQEIFSIDDGTGDPPEVTWTVESGPGSINQNGVFTAGGTPSEVVIRATRTDNDKFKEQSFNVGCGLSVVVNLPTSALPSGPASYRANASGFYMAGIGSVLTDLFVEYTEVTPPAGDASHGHVVGNYSGGGIYFPQDPDEIMGLIDDSEARRTYTVSSGSITTDYDVFAVFGPEEFNDDGRLVNLPGGRDGSSMQLMLEARSSSAGNAPGVTDNEIVSYIWTFSDGDELGGEEVTKTFDRNIGELRVTLEVRDKLGNWARYAQTYIIAKIDGTMSFAYNPEGELLSCLFWDFPIDPPGEGTPGIIYTTNPDECTTTGVISGGRSATGSASSSAAGFPPDEPYYVLGFQPAF